jgi:hypothetical protein
MRWSTRRNLDKLRGLWPVSSEALGLCRNIDGLPGNGSGVSHVHDVAKWSLEASMPWHGGDMADHWLEHSLDDDLHRCRLLAPAVGGPPLIQLDQCRLPHESGVRLSAILLLQEAIHLDPLKPFHVFAIVHLFDLAAFVLDLTGQALLALVPDGFIGDAPGLLVTGLIHGGEGITFVEDGSLAV